MSQASSQPTKRSARVVEKERNAQKTADDCEIPLGYLFLFYFEVDVKFSKVRADSPRWPKNFSNNSKISLGEGDIVLIKCGKDNVPTYGEFRALGCGSKINYVMRQSLIERNEGINASKIVAEDIAREYDGNLDSDNDFEPEGDSQSPAYSTKKPRLESDVRSDLDNINLPDDPNLDLGLMNKFLEFQQRNDKAQSNKQPCSSSAVPNNAEEVIFYLSSLPRKLKIWALCQGRPFFSISKGSCLGLVFFRKITQRF